MEPFATEFPVVKTVNRRSFVNQLLTWLRGTEYSTVLEDRRDRDIDGEAALLRTENGEELRLRVLGQGDDFEAIGFRHDYPDGKGRLWRTDAVLRRPEDKQQQCLLRLRTQCMALSSGARLETPRKPYLIKTLLREGWGGEDGQLRVAADPLWLTEDDAALDVARSITLGRASRHLPVIYVSATGPAEWLLSETQINNLAFDLGGVAHVVVEPNRGFSFRLRDATGGANVYGGTLAIAEPSRGVVRRFFLGWRLADVSDLIGLVTNDAISLRSHMPATGWDWTEIQEQALRVQRERDRNRLNAKETEVLYEAEIANLKDRIQQLETQLAAAPVVGASESESGILPTSLVQRIGTEIYPGEFTDRIRLAVKFCRSRADQDGLAARSKVVFEAVATAVPSSLGLSELREDLKRSTKDPGRVAAQLTALLLRHGYREKSDNRHVRLEAMEGYRGLGKITLSKTPSDDRGLTNTRKQIERTLGIAKLSE